MIRHIALSGMVLAGAIGWPGAARADERGEQLAAVLEKVAPSVVTLKMVGKVRGRERNFDFQGTVVSSTGLILCDDGNFGGGFAKVDVQSIKVIIDRDEETEIEAFHVATDTKLQLAYLQIENLGDRKLSFVDLKDDASAKIGQQVVSVTRFPKGYDFAPAFFTARVGAKVKKPRKVWWADGRILDGMPVFALDGKLLGVGAQVSSGLSERSGGGALFILPARPLRASVQQAEKKAIELAAERAKEKAEGGKKDDDGEKKDDAKKDDDSKKKDDAKKDDAGEGDGDAKKDDDQPKKDDGAGKSDGAGK
jgi:S1-C subfamily serine protease